MWEESDADGDVGGAWGGVRGGPERGVRVSENWEPQGPGGRGGNLRRQGQCHGQGQAFNTGVGKQGEVLRSGPGREGGREGDGVDKPYR